MNEAIEIQLSDSDIEKFREQIKEGKQPVVKYIVCCHKITLRYFGNKL